MKRDKCTLPKQQCSTAVHLCCAIVFLIDWTGPFLCTLRTLDFISRNLASSLSTVCVQNKVQHYCCWLLVVSSFWQTWNQLCILLNFIMNIQILRRDRFSSVKNNPYLINKDTLITDCNFIMIITFQAAGGQRTRTPALMTRAPCSMTQPPSTPRPAVSPPRPWRTAPTGWTRPARSGENIQVTNTIIFKSN